MDTTNLEFFLKKLSTENEDFLISEKKEDLSKGTIDNYCTYLRTLDSLNKGQTLNWIKEARSKSMTEKNADYDREVTEIVADTLDKFANSNSKIGKYDIGDVRSALKILTRYYMSIFDGVYTVGMNKYISDEELAQMIAQTAIFVKPNVVRQVVNGENGYVANNYASADNCEHQRKKSGQKKGGTIIKNGITIKLDDNTTPNRLLKKAIVEGMDTTEIDWQQFRNYTVCHIWGEPYDNRAFCSLVNLVMIPKAIYGLSDHHPVIQKILQQKSYDLFSEIPGIKFPYEYISTSLAPSLSNKEKEIYENLKWRNIYL